MVCLTAIDLIGADQKYTDIIKPLFRERCYACHGALKQKAALRVDTVAAMREAGIVIPGQPEKSELFQRIVATDADERMPPEGHAISLQDVAAIKSWIANGAAIPAKDLPEDDPLSHWAFQKIKKPDLPKSESETNPIDAFLAAKHREYGLRPQPMTKRSIAIRRLYLDLIGLPPTPEQLADDSTWQDIVDELLANPHHGERWARHWMDVWRYSEWYGLGAQLRYSQKHIWHWRDWIIESLNQDKGYDQMIREMLAGDELAPDDPSILRATGFLARNYYLFNRTTWLDSTIEHTGKAFLGLTLNCAKCHDHKYDPIDMKDYYTFRAIFEPHQVRLDPVPGTTDLDKEGLPRVFDDHLEATTYIHKKGDPKQPDKTTAIEPAVPAFLGSFAKPVRKVDLPLVAFAPGSQAKIQQDHLKAATEKLLIAERKLDHAKTQKTTAQKTPQTSLKPIKEDFSVFDRALWKLEKGGLEFRNGGLQQTTATRTPGQLISLLSMPQDFQFTCRYTVTGGSTYRSVTFRFDRDDSNKNANYIYTSEHAPGPKVQAAYSRNGKTSYPADGRKSKEIAIGKVQELRVAVRGTLANVWLDGEFQLAYRFPNRIDGGKFSLSGFDALVTFHSLEIDQLPADLKFTEAKNTVSQSIQPEIAQLEYQAAKAGLASIKATIAADQYRYRHYPETKSDKSLEENGRSPAGGGKTGKRKSHSSR